MLYSAPGDASTEAGVFQGTASAASGQFASADAKDYPIAHDTETFQLAVPASVSGSYAAETSLNLSLAGRASARTLTAAYVSGSNQPPSVAALAGTYQGFSGHASGERDATFTVDASGNLSGSNAAQCSFAGTVTARASIKAFDVTLRSVGIPGNCIFGLGPISGVLHYDEAARQIHAFMPYASRNDLYYVIGTKQ